MAALVSNLRAAARSRLHSRHRLQSFAAPPATSARDRNREARRTGTATGRTNAATSRSRVIKAATTAATETLACGQTGPVIERMAWRLHRIALMNVALAPAWTHVIDGKTYAVRRIGGHIYEVWRDGQQLGSFEFHPHTPQGPVAYVHDGPEARAVANAFVDAYRNETA
jgi:hypothetical protein